MASTITASTPMENSSCWSWITVKAIGRQARGKCSARISPRLSVIDRVPASTADWVNWNTKTPVHRYAMKLGMPRLVPSSRPKIR